MPVLTAGNEHSPCYAIIGFGVLEATAKQNFTECCPQIVVFMSKLPHFIICYFAKVRTYG
ncbi:MAG: hypothetical protein CSA79_06065 [Thiothrix nivea]|nr:MAG: hypothetical protein CSA79_06065 [Thiothrix nivea]